MKVRLFYFLLILFIIINPFSGRSQTILENYQAIVSTSLKNTEKVDSLYNFYNRNYFKDYQLVDSLAKVSLQFSKDVKYTRGEAVIQIVLALVQENIGKLYLSEHYAKNAVSILNSNNLEKDLPRAYYALGTFYRRKNRNAEAMNEFLNGLKVSEKLKDSSGMRLLYTSIAILNVTEKNYDKALFYHLKALDISKKIKDESAEQKCYTNIGIVYSRRKDYDEALKYHTLALKLAIKLDDERTVAFVYNDLGSTYLYKGDYVKSIQYLKKSIEIRERVIELSELSYTYNYLGQAYAKSRNFSESEKWLKRSYVIAKQIDNNKQIFESYEELSTMYASFNKFDSAFVYSHKYNLFRDSIRQIENSESLNQLSAQYEAEKQEQQIKELSQQNTIQELQLKQRKFFLGIAIVLIIIVLLIAYLIYYKRKQKERRLNLEAQLLKIESEQKITSERVRISRDLHDNIGSYLTFINSSMAAVNAENEEQQEKLTQIKGLTTETIKELRKTVWLINKTEVSLEEFSVKLRELFKNIPHFKINVSGVVENKLSAQQATEVFRVIQESVNNAIKHSEASEITLHLEGMESNLLKVVITDNGKGFDMRSASTGFGLSNMKSRIQDLNGAFDLTSEPGEGTKIFFTLSLENK